MRSERQPTSTVKIKIPLPYKNKKVHKTNSAGFSEDLQIDRGLQDQKNLVLSAVLESKQKNVEPLVATLELNLK